jgi:hypothetical protein
VAIPIVIVTWEVIQMLKEEDPYCGTTVTQALQQLGQYHAQDNPI